MTDAELAEYLHLTPAEAAIVIATTALSSAGARTRYRVIVADTFMTSAVELRSANGDAARPRCAAAETNFSARRHDSRSRLTI